MSETELLEAFREDRSEEAFAQLVRHFAGLVYSVARRRLANAAMAEDITQMVFIRLAKTPPNVRTHAELAAWLHRTTVNVTIDTWRSETRRRSREQQAVIMEPPTSENAIWEEISPNLDEALNQLNEDDRQALLLRFFCRKTMRDVGAALGVSEDAAKMRVSRAVDRLRTQLGVGGRACTAALLAAILMQRSVEAVPSQLLARLAAIKLPVAAVGVGGLLAALMQISRLKLAAGAVVLAIVGVGTVQLVRSLHAPIPKQASENSITDPAGNTSGSAGLRRVVASDFDASMRARTSEAPAIKKVKVVFHVLDAETGVGLANTKVHYAYFGAGGAGEGHNMLTDYNGYAAILEPDDPAKNGGPNVFVTAEGHVPKVVGFGRGAAPADYTIQLDRAMTIGGVIADEQGLPVAGVQISIQGPGNKPGQMENVDFQTCPVTNRDDGTWTCSYIPRDYTNEIRLILKKTGFATTFPVVPVARVDLANLVLVINRGFVVSGQVTDLQNGPIPNAKLRILSGNRSRQQSSETDENGVFEFVGVPGEASDLSYKEPPLERTSSGAAIIRGQAGQGKMQVELVVQADGYAPQKRIVELPATTNIANFKLSPGNIFRGRVVDEAGNPIPNAVVQTDWDNQGIRAFEWTTRTDAEGRFKWDSAPEEQQLFWFEADAYQWQRDVGLVADGSDHEITLKSKSGR